VDVPRGPVNNGRTAGRELSLSLTVAPLGQKPFPVRYIVIGDLSKAKQVVLYLHGLGSRAEEGEGVGQALLAKSEDYALIAPDLPWNGYTMAPSLSDADLALDYDWDGAPNRRFPALEALKCFVAEFVTKVPGLEGNAERGAHQAQGGVCADLGCGHDDRVGGDATEQRVGSPHPLLRLQLHRRPPALRGAQLSVVVERGVPGDGRG